jgi:hypothetical protein
MHKIIKVAFLLVMIFLLSGILPFGEIPRTAFAQEQESLVNEDAADHDPAMLQIRTAPEALRRPQRGEPARYPEDFEIGALGQGQAPEAAYLFALNVLAALTAGDRAAPALAALPQAILGNRIEEIGSIEPLSFRIGSGRVEADETVSFLVRFIGREESITGELFLFEGSEQWLLDDLIIEEARSLADIRSDHRFIFSPYERFF